MTVLFLALRVVAGTFLAAALIITSAPATSEPKQFLGSVAWLEDFEQLKSEMSAHYANLQWIRARRHLNLPALSATTETRLRAAQSDDQARTAIRQFLDAFKDGHLEVSWPKPAMTRTPPNAVVGACADYREGERAPGLDFAALEGATVLASPQARYFPEGVLTDGTRRRIGWLRIDLFDEHRFPELCLDAARKLNINVTKICAEECEGPLEREVGNLLTAALEEQLRRLSRQGIAALVVDITNNGGGSNWVLPAARVFTARRLRQPRQGFIRHEHWAEQFRDNIRTIDDDLKVARERDRPLLRLARSRYARALQSTGKRCDQSPLWRGARLNCSFVSRAGPLYAAGAIAYARPGSLPKGISCCYLFGAQRYRYHEGVYSGPLYIAVDGDTASAAEFFAAVLADNHAATIVGEHTFGAGCGYTNGGIPTVLKNSRGIVRMPDCVRYRRDGTNEVIGIVPHRQVAWRRGESSRSRAADLIRRIGTPPGRRAVSR